MKFSEILKNDISSGTLTNNVSGTPAQGTTGDKKKFSEILKSDIERGEIGSEVKPSEPEKADVAEKTRENVPASVKPGATNPKADPNTYSPLMVKTGETLGVDFSTRDKAADAAAFNTAASKIRAESAKQAEKDAEDRAKKLSYNVTDGQSNIDELSDDLSRMEELANNIADAEKWLADYEERNWDYRARYKHRYDTLTKNLSTLKRELDGLNALYEGESVSKLQEKLRSARVYHSSAIKLQTLEKLTSDAFETENFIDKYSPEAARQVFSKKMSFENANKDGVIVYPYTDAQINTFNEVNGVESYNEGVVAQSIYGYLTREEKAVFNKYFLEDDWDSANEYLELMQDTLSMREANARFGELRDNTFGEIVFGAEAGLDNAVLGGVNAALSIAGKEGITSPTQILSDMVRDDLKDDGPKIFGNSLGQIAFDATNTTAYMLPSILVGTINPTAGSIVMGASTTGNAYHEMLQLGYSTEQARSYARLVGASETALQRFLGGISKLGGTATGKLAENVAIKLDNALAKLAINHPHLVSGIKTGARLGVRIGGEVIEEDIQLLLEPAFKTLVADEAYLAPNFEEIAYTTILTVLTTATIESTTGAINKQPANEGKNQRESSSPPTTSTNALPIVNEAVDTTNTSGATTHAQATPVDVKSGNESATSNETSTATPTDTSTDKAVSAESASELEEITGADEVVRFTPETAGGEIKRIETALITQGADDNSRREIVETALGFNAEPTENSKTVRDMFAEAVKLTSDTVAKDKSAAETSGGYWRLLADNFKSIALPARSETDASVQTSHTDVQTAPVSVEAVSEVTAPSANGDNSTVTSGIVNLKRLKNVYSLFKGAARSVVGKDVITDGYVAIPLTDEAVAAVEKFAPGTVQHNPEASLEKFYNRGNNVVISGDPKIDDIKVSGKTEKGYVFKIGDSYYSCQQKFIDAFNDGKNIITANKDIRIPWTVHNENGDLVAIFMGSKHNMGDERFNSLQSVSEAKAAEAQQKAENAGKPFNQNEVRQIFGGGTPYFTDINGETFIGEGHIFVRCDEVAVQFMKDEYRKQNSNSNYEIGQNDNIGTRAEKMFAEASELSDITGIAPYTGTQKGEIAYPVGDLAIAFNKNYANIIKKRSNTVKIVSGGDGGTTALVGYDADGGITGFALPVLSHGTVTAPDGKAVPLVTEVDIKKLADETSTVAAKSSDQVLKTEQNRGIIEEKSTVGQTDADNISTKETEVNEKVTVQDSRRSGQSSQRNNEGTQSQNGNRSRVQSENGESGGSIKGAFGSLERQRDLSDIPPRYPADACIAPKPNSIEEHEAATLQEYGIEWRVVKKQVWDRGELPAFVNNGTVYLREDIKEHKGRIAPHEATHVMRQIEYAPYLDFINRTPSMLNMGSDIARRLIAGCAEKIGVSLDAGSDQFQRVYDEINATIYGNHVGGDIVGEIRSQLEDAFYDFDAYISELQAIHEQFKRDNNGSATTSDIHLENVTANSKGTRPISKYVAAKLANGKKITALELAKVANVAFGGTMADGAYTIKDAYDAMELGVNKHILAMDNVSAEKMLELLELLPTQTKRTEDMVKYQQFSTPPSIAYLANYAANVNSNDIMLEPSAGIGGIAVFAKREGASVYVNELDPRRLDIIKELPFDGFFNENAEQLDNILGGQIEPTVIVMNPPFSSSSERNIQNTKIGAKHIEQALKILAPNGRLVAIVGHGMGDGAPAFRGWWKDIKSQYNVRANIRINGKNYNKYGTNFDIQMLVIDKNGATTHTETGFVDTLQELQDKLGGIRNERPVIDYSTNEHRTPTAARTETAQAGETAGVGNRAVSDAGRTADKGKSADNANRKGQSERKSVQSTVTERRTPAVGETANTNVVADANSGMGTGQQRGPSVSENIAGVSSDVSGQSDIQTGRNEPRKRVKRKELTDSIFEHYQTQPLKLNNTRPHPAKVSESAAMSAIEPPAVTYKPSIPQSIVEDGVLSDVQLEAISYAGQSHSQTLPNGTTRGFFLGDGTGIGKGRTIAGMMLDNYNQGRKKSLWVTLNSSLVNDAKRDVKALFGTSDLVTQFVGGNKADSVLNTDEAVMVVSYSALSKGFDNSGSNFDKIVKWLGKDFDGLIVFDEAHKMGNATATKGTRGVKKASQTGLAGIALQEALPKAKIVYSSATGATEVENLRYAERLGLWGEGTAFATGDDFVSKIKAGGLAAMELIARDMKAMGVYLSRNISYEDVRYDKITHKLTSQQRAIYDELARSWQIVLNNIHKALETTNQGKDGTARGRALGAFWSSQQRFFNQILTSMQVPSVIADIEKQLADGKSCVIQLVSTNEAAQNDEFARLKAEDLELDEFDLTPKQMLMSYIENSFPVQQFEEYRDDEGNIRSKPVYDSQGNPVLNRDAVKQREELLAKLGSIKVPSSPIDMIINHFGTDLVAENTGRARRVVQKDGKFIEEKIASKKDADVDAFQNGNKRIIIFSKAGGTGKSYHADRAAKNQQQRVHYLLEAGWQADNAVQGFGRSHRSNQASAPIFKLVTTDLKGQMRFISTIAKRLDQLGAMTKGQRQAGGQGMFSASDNLENSFAADVLAVFYKDLVANRVDGISDGLAVIEKLGLREKILDQYNRIIVTAPELREVNKFLNRILSLESSEQNTVFDGYSERLQDATEKAMLAGTLDKGLENYKADRITLNEVQDIREDERSGAKTKYYNLTAEHKIKPIQFGDIAADSKAFVGFYQSKTTGAIRAVMQTSSTTDQYGNVTSNYKLVGQVKNDYIPQNRFYGNWTEVKTEDAEKLWNDEIAKLPEFRKENLHLISGVVLPVWDKLPTENVRIYRVLTSDGEMLIGRVIPEDAIDETLRRLGSTRTREKVETKDLVAGVKNGDTVHLENGWKIVQRKVSGENRIEVVGPSYEHYDILTKKGVFTERIQYNTRYFVPANTNTEKIVDEILKLSPVLRVENVKYTLSTESEGTTDEKSGNGLLSGSGRRDSDASAGKQAERISAYKRKLEGKTAAERKDYAKKLLEKGQTEEVIDGTHKYTLVKPEAYNDDMLAIIEDAKSRGKEVGFFIGNAIRKFDGKREFKIDGIKISDSKILLRYDGEYTPQTLLVHEDAHADWNTPEMQDIKETILGGISDEEKAELRSVGRYKAYADLYKNNPDAVWEEFVADVLAGMNDYTPDFIDVIADYYFGEQTVDRYSPREYNSIIDAGGNDAVLNDVGFGDDNLLPERGNSNGYEQTGVGKKLGRLGNPGEIEGHARVGEVGYSQSQESNTPHTKRVHRSGVSAETVTSSGLTAEQTALRVQNEMEGQKTEFYTRAKDGGVPQTKVFTTEHTVYYPDSGFERNDVVINNGVVSFTEKRLNDLIEDFSVPKGGQLNQNYAKGYVAYISPSDFLSLTTVNEQKIVEDTKTKEKYGGGKLDAEILSGTVQTPFLEIDFEEGTVTAHEGRHRMAMLRDAGAERVAIVIKDIDVESGKYRTEKLTNVLITGQKFSIGTAPGSVTLDEIIPLSPNYRAEVRAKFVENEASLRYTLSTSEADTAELTPERKKEIFEQYKRDRAEVEKPSLKQLWGERAAWVAHNMTRVFPNIPERGERGTFFAEFRKSMIQWKNLPTTASFMVQDKLNKMTEGLTPKEFKTFSELVYFLDLQEEAEIQKERGFTEILLPNEITPAEVDAVVNVLNEEATPNVKNALIKRQNIWDALKAQYIDLNRYIGFDTDGKFKRKNYYHHQVIDYMNSGGKGTGSREIGIKAGRGWLKERQGSTKAINTDFLAVEYKAMLQMQYDVYIAETLGKIKQQYDIKPQLEEEAFRHNKQALNEIIRKEATDKNGNVVLDSKGKPDSETYRQQMWYNSRIMFGFSGLFDLADRGELPTYDGEYSSVVTALKRHDLNVSGLYKYVGVLASTTLPDDATDAQEQAVTSARTVLKYTSQKKAWIKELLADEYQTWETIAKSMSDTHTIHQPRRGNYFYTKTVIDEDAFNKAHNDMVLALASGEVDLGNVDLNKLFTQYADTVRLTGAAYEQWVLPNEIVTTMNEIANPKQASAGAKAARAVVSAWKGWATSVNPLRTVKFGIRNLYGDLDAVIAGNPKVILNSKKAVQDIYNAMRHKKYSPEFIEWVERGGYTSMIFANEMDSEMQDKLFVRLKEKEGLELFKIPAKLFEGYYNGVETVHNFREAILRYSAYLHFKKQIEQNAGVVKDYVASNRYIVRGLNTTQDKAYQLSKDLLGAYDEVGKMGQTLRRYWLPFYSFTETNLKRYYRLFENIIASDDRIPKKAGKLLLKALMVNMLGLLMAAWNKFVMEDEDDELPPSVRNIPHLTLGKIGDSVYAFRQLGSFSEILEWFGLEDYKWTSEDLTAPLDKAWGMVTPFVKMPVELVSGLNFYPSLTAPRSIRDKWQHFFNSFGVDDVYSEVTGKPTRGMGEILKGAFVYSYDYKESAYYEILDLKREYQGKTDNTIYGTNAKSNALYYMKTAVRYKDRDAALKYLDEYFDNGGTVKGIKQSFATLNPMYGFTSKDTMENGRAFIASLTDEQREKLKIAQDFYENDLMLPETVLDKLGKKGITDEEAKNVLRNYIKAKCK